jgi:hypothetical protein
MANSVIPKSLPSTEAVSVTAGNNITVAWNYSARCGNVVSISVSLTATANVASEDAVLTDLPARYTDGGNAQMFFYAMSTATLGSVNLAMTNGRIVAKQTIPSGTTIRFSFTYIAND